MHYFERKKISELITLEESQLTTEPVLVMGWVRTRRDMKGFSFLEVNDGSCFGNLQITFDHDKGFAVDTMRTGTSVLVKGILKPINTKKQKVEMAAMELTILGECPEDFPMQKKRHSFEYLREVAHLRPRTNAFGAINRFRSKIAHACHSWFQDRGFYWASTPLITTSDCEGAGEMFKVTTMDLQNLPKIDGHVDFSQDFFMEETALTVSGQLEGEIMACALGDIYTFGPAFRAENSNTARHLSELWMIEPEMAFCDLAENRVIATTFLKDIFRYALEKCPDEMDFFDSFIEKGIVDSLTHIVNSDFESITYTQAIDILKKAESKGEKFDFSATWGPELQTEHERFLAEKHFKRPVVVTDYPKDAKSFYMRLNDDDKTVAAMDVLLPRIGEIIGGSQREERLDVLDVLIEKHQVPAEKLWWYRELRKYGSVPHSGFGVGFERLLMYMSGFANIRDVIPFPRTPRNAKF